MKQYSFDYTQHLDQLLPLLSELVVLGATSPQKKQLEQLIKRHSKAGGKLFARDEIISAYRQLAGSHSLPPLDPTIIKLLQMKPTRTISGVTPITVLTKPFPCPGKCIFCPNDVRMPKSYLSDEPGAQRAERNYFDPYLQTYNRLQALHNIGHTVDKAELIVLGGTWSYYPESYQVWFINECFRALNEFGVVDNRAVVEEKYQGVQRAFARLGKRSLSNNPAQNKNEFKKDEIDGTSLSKSYNRTVSELYVAPEKKLGIDAWQTASWAELEQSQRINETALVRSVGLVLETRPDNISETEVIRLRRLGCTKTQIGFQSLQDTVLAMNKRGHDVAATRRAVRLLRLAGFKIHAHWMANLHGSTVALDKKDYATLFSDPDFRPDELKIYPCSLIGSAELMQYYQRGEWQPYSYEELLEVLSFALKETPEYCRLTRVIRDIPSTDIVSGNKKTNFRQIAEQSLARAGERSQDIRAREVRQGQFSDASVYKETFEYETSVSQEKFIQLLAPVTTEAGKTEAKLVGFARLSLPIAPSFIDELGGAAIIRELHVYGQTVAIGGLGGRKAQHRGFGKQLLQEAERVAREAEFEKLAVISAVGTREYYRKQGFTDGKLYQFFSL